MMDAKYHRVILLFFKKINKKIKKKKKRERKGIKDIIKGTM